MTGINDNCREYLDQAPYGLFIFNKKGKIFEVNPAACRISGLSRENLLELNIFDLISEKLKTSAPDKFDMLIEEGTYSGTVLYNKPNKSECFIDIDAVKISDDRYFAFIKDVSEEKRTEAALKSRLRLEKIISGFSSSLTIVDSENIDKEINKAFLHLGAETGVDRIYFFLYSDDLVFCSNIYEWCADGISPQIDNLQNIKTVDSPWWTSMMNSNKAIMLEDLKELPPEASVEKKVLSEQGIKSIVIIPSFYNGELKGFFGFDSVRKKREWSGEDIYLLRMAGNSLCNSIIRVREQKARLMLEEKIIAVERLESIGKLAGGVAHDFNNIMQIISGYTELSIDSEGASVKKYLEEIKKASVKASELTAQLLAFARKQHVSPRIIDLNNEIQRAIGIAKRLISPDIFIDLKAGSDLWPVFIDPTQVEQIITNMLINSSESINGKGSIIIETYNDVIDNEYCLTHPYFYPGEFAVITVSDTGCGMDDETQAHLFEPFFSTKTSTGSGLGLSTVYGIVKQNEGYIIVYSEVGMGSTFKVYLKKVDSPDAVYHDKTGQVSDNSPLNKNILVVEDELSILTLISRVLSKAGYHVVTAEDGEEAISIANETQQNFDLLITDVVMPGINGNEVNDKIIEIFPDIRTIFMSGYTANIIADRGILDHGINFLQKPFSVNQLLDKVKEVFGEN